MRRKRAPFNDKRFIGNTNSNEVHDLDNEDRYGECNIPLIRDSHVKTFSPDTHAQAKREGFDNCAKCIGNSKH
ncbi:hypothetical protein [Salibacterium aidingense]|uniref:hypothetical protein n=1 Tax=Salibacterium aidingense TaxID=384933 RepID=UPI00041BC619|nr:hypothetical protein [Salibacterium aidingense]